MKEIGATLDLSESRVSQMHSSIVARLQAQLAKRQGRVQQLTPYAASGGSSQTRPGRRCPGSWRFAAAKVP